MASNHRLHLSALKWNMTKADIEKETQLIIDASNAVLDAIASNSGESCTWDTVMAPLASMERDVESRAMSSTFVKDVSVDKEIRDAATVARKELRAWEVKAGMRRDVFLAVKTYAERADLAALDSESRRFVERTLRDYRRRGLDLPDAERARIEDLRTRMSAISLAFGQTLAEDSTKLAFSRDELRGMPDDWLSGLGM